MSPSFLNQLKFYELVIVCPLAILANLLFCILMYKCSTGNLKSYLNVLVLGVAVDLSYSVVLFLFGPTPFLYENIYSVFLDGVLGPLPEPVPSWVWTVVIFYIYFSACNPAVQFVYRYLLLCWDIKLRTRGFIGLVLIAAFLCFLYCLVWIWMIFSREEDYESKYAARLQRTEFFENGVLPPRATFENDYIVRYGGIAVFINVCSYVVVIFCAARVYAKLKKTRTELSPSLKRIQNQINIVLLVEALLPLVTIVIPTSLDIIQVLAESYWPWAGRLIIASMTIGPLVNPIVKVLVMTPYRRAVLRFIRFRGGASSTRIQSRSTIAFVEKR